MQFSKIAVGSTLVATSLAAGYTPGDEWSTLTPTATYTDGLSSFPSTFGIAVSPITTGSIYEKYAATATASATSGVTTTLAPSSSSSTNTATSTSPINTDPIQAAACVNDGTLKITLEDSILRDEKGRIGSIVANRQFQFDGPPPQAGAIYAAGWSITQEGNLAIGDEDVFFQCLSGEFYNLYDEHVGSQCEPIYLQVLDLVEC
ncbi:hypothetical protein ACO0QE_003101 [Hanseniaspora vineae]